MCKENKLQAFHNKNKVLLLFLCKRIQNILYETNDKNIKKNNIKKIKNKRKNIYFYKSIKVPLLCMWLSSLEKINDKPPSVSLTRNNIKNNLSFYCSTFGAF